MIQYLLEASLCSIGFISFYYIALRNKRFHRWNRIFLNGTLMMSLLIPLLYIPIETIIYVPQQITNSPSIAQAVTGFVFSWQEAVLCIYLMGCLIMLFLFVKEIIEISKIITYSEKEKFPNYSLVKLDKEFPLCSFLNFIICEKNTYISQYQMDHELTHIHQKHSYDKVFVELIKILLWFNPAIYLYQKSIHAVHEFLADETVVALHGNESYQQHLIQSFTKQHIELATVNPFHSLIKNRLHMLNNKKESTKTIFLFAIPIIACLIFFMSCEETTKVIVLEDKESNLNYTEDGMIILTDTIMVFDDQTFEETMQIVTNEVTPEEYREIQKNKVRYVEDELNAKNDNSGLITVIDTIVTFNADTYEESIQYVKTHMTTDEYERRQKGYSKYEPAYGSTGAGAPHSLHNSSENPNQNLITVVDTVVTFNADTYEESIQYVKTQMTAEEYDERIQMINAGYEPFREQSPTVSSKSAEPTGSRINKINISKEKD